MGFRDPFQYRSRSDIDKGYPDLHNGSKWSLKKIQKLKTNSLKLIASINLTSLDLRLDAIWLAQSYFQRYFTQNSFKDNTAVVFSTACIHMACKASDLPRPLDKVIKETYRLRFTREEVERKKIDDLMVFVEFKEKVLMAERALLYCLAFDFRTGDPYSYALKYNSAYKLNSIDQALPWLNRAGQVTTLCLQYPPSTLAVVALWYAQHVEIGKIPVDENGLEWWEKLPVEKQDRFPLPPPTPESIEDIHWQLIVELDEKSLEAAVKDSGKLPGRLDTAAAAPAAAPATAPATAPAAAPAGPANPSQEVPDTDFPLDSNVRSQGQSSGLLEVARETGASAPRTGISDASATAATAHPPTATPTSSAGVGEATAGTASGAPAHIDQPSSAYPVRVVPPGGATLDPGSGSAATAALAYAGSNGGPHASSSGQPGHLQNGLGATSLSPLQQPVPNSKGGLSRQQPAPSETTSQSNHTEGQAQHQQHSVEPAHAYQNGHQHATADDDDDAKSLEDGEIEDGEVLPDGTIMGARDDMQSGGALPHAYNNGDGHSAQPLQHASGSAASAGKSQDAAKKRKRSVSPDLEGAAHANGYDSHKRRTLPHGMPT